MVRLHPIKVFGVVAEAVGDSQEEGASRARGASAIAFVSRG